MDQPANSQTPAAAPRQVGDVMTHDARSMRPEQSFAEVVGMMAGLSFRHLLVIDDDQRLHGVISDRDVLRALSRTPDWSKKTVRDVMTAEPVTAIPEMPISVAIKSMLALRINCLPVLNADGRVVGILTSTDLLKAYEKVQEQIEPREL